MSDPCDPMDCSPPGSSVHGILQARTLEWVAIPFSRGSFQPRKRTLVSCTAGRWCRDDVVSTANSWAPCPDLLEETSGGEIFNQCFYQLTCMCTNIRNYRNKEEKKEKSLSRVWLFATPLTVAHQAPLSMGFSRQEYWSGVPCPPPGNLPHPGIEPGSPTLRVDALPSEPPGKPVGIKICA